jgi:hypothetical protein
MIGVSTSVYSSLMGTGFSPASLFATSEPGVWLDPSDLTTMFQDTAGTIPVTAPGQSVARINDKSGRGNNATQATAASRPTYQVDGNGRGYLSFDGVDDFLVTPTITPGIDKAQVFAGVRKLSDAAAGMLVESSFNSVSNNGSFYVTAPEPTTSSYKFLSRGTFNSPVSASLGVYPAPTTNVLTSIGDISGNNSTLRVNGAQVAQNVNDQGSGDFLAYPLYIGRRGGTSLPFNGHIYSLIVRFGANLTAAQIAQTEAWVNGKTGAF